MAKKRFFLIFWISFILLSFGAYANVDYVNAGSNNTDFNLGRGIFSTVDELGVTYYTAGLTDSKRIPLVTDADGNGISEVYVMDDDEVKVYEGIELDFKASFDYYSGTPRTSYPIMFDIDGDNVTEYIFAVESTTPYPEIVILSYNGTDLVNETTYQDSDFGVGDSIITCIDTNKCLYTGSNYYTAQDIPATVTVTAVSFNSTDDIDKVTLFSESYANDILFCRSDVPYISHGVKNNVDYYFISYILGVNGGGGNGGVYIAWVSVDSDNQLTLEHDTDEGLDLDINGASVNCNDISIRSFFTSPLASEGLLDDVGYEIVVGYQTSSSEYRMDLYDNDGDFKDDFPETDDSDGVLIGNVFMMDAFPQSSTLGRTFCVVGWDFEDEQQTLTCGSKFKSGLAETNEYVWNIPDGYNNSINDDIANSVCHSGQQSNALTDSIDLDEFLTTYGVFSVDDDSCSFSAIKGKYECEADREFMNGAGLSALISADLEHIGNDDLLAMTDTALYLFDDGISNAPVDQVDIYYNPCPVDTIIKVNETMLITVTGYDGNEDYSLDNDLLRYNITVYKDTNNQMVDSAVNVTSGSPRTFTFNLNKTTASGIIEIIVTDNIAGNDPFIVTQSFVVATDGVEYGDTTCTNSYFTEEEEETAAETGAVEETDITDNSILNAANTIYGLTGIGGSLLWFIIMFVVAIGMWMNGKSGAESTTLGAVALVEIILLILGVMLGFISIALIIIFVLLAIIVIGLWIGRMITGTSN
jgi:hypothetical protein